MDERRHPPAAGWPARSRNCFAGDSRLQPIRAGLPLLLACALSLASLTGTREASLLAQENASLASIEKSMQPLTLGELERLALHRHPALQAARAQIEAAHGEAQQAGQYPNPWLAYDSSSLGSDGRAGTHGFYVEQEFITARKLEWDQTRARHEAARRDWNSSEQQARLLAEVRLQYFEILALDQQVRLANYVLAQRRHLQELARELVNDDSDEVTGPDLVLADGHTRRAALNLHNLQSRRRGAVEDLAARLGYSELVVRPLAGSLEAAPFGLPDEPRLRAALTAAHPQVQAAQAAAARNQAALQRQMARATPNVTVRAGAVYDFVDEEPLANFRASLPLPVFHRNEGAIRAAEAELRQAQFEVQQATRQVEQRLARALDIHRRNAATVEEYRRYQLPQAGQAFEIYWQRFKDEKASYQRIESALDSLADRWREYYDALLEMRRIEVRTTAGLLDDL